MGPGGRDWSHVAISPGMPTASSSWKRQRTFSSKN